MNFTFKKTALTLTALTSLAIFPAYAADNAFSDAQKDEIGAVVKDYLKENPSAIIEALDAYRAQQEQDAQDLAAGNIKKNIASMTDAEQPSIGNPDGDVTVVEFFDYNCGYCKRAVPDIQKVLKEDDNVRFVFQEMPILGPSSRTAAIWALAAHKQDKYFDYHVALMEHRGPKEAAQLEKLAEEHGLDVDQMKKDIESGEIQKELDELAAMARGIGVSGTPAFIIGETFIPGYVGEQGLKDAIKAEREKLKNDG